MNNFYTLLSLVEELRYKISGNKISDVWSHRKDQIDFFLDPDDAGKVTFSASSPGTALFWDARAGAPSRNAASFFPELQGETIADLSMASDNDRLIRMTFESSPLELIFKPFSSRPNVFLVENGIIRSAFKSASEGIGSEAPQPVASASPQQQKTSSDLPLKKRIVSMDRQFPRGLIPDITDTCQLDDDVDDETLRNTIHQLQHHLQNPDSVSITAEGYISLLPSEYLSHPPDRSFDSINNAVRTMFLNENRKYRLLPRKNDLLKKLQKRLRKLEKQKTELEKMAERQTQADLAEHYGHLLMSQPDPALPVQTDAIEVPDWSNEGEQVQIPVKSGLTLVEQAQKYYEKATRIRREVEMSGKKRKQIDLQREEVADRIGELEEISHPPALEKWLKQHRDRLQQLGMAASDAKQQSRPYRQVSSGGYEIWIGKSAKSNDEMLSLAHKEDIWMHARGTAGSHVIVRNQGQIDWPDPTLLQKAASWAAAYSRQSGSSMVPVMIAKRKHVRKPKGAAPGLVTVTNERVEMVTPKKPDLPDS